MPDQNHKHEFLFEVNWNPKDKTTNQCQVVKITSPDGMESYVKREHLHSILFAIGREQDQVNLIPQKQETIRNIETVLGIKASKDIYKGEMINVRVKIPVPVGSQEIIGKVKQSTSFIT